MIRINARGGHPAEERTPGQNIHGVKTASNKVKKRKGVGRKRRRF